MTRLIPAVALLLIANLDAASGLVDISRGWEYRPVPSSNESWHKRSELDRKAIRKGHAIWLRHALPDIAAPPSTLVFSSFISRVAVYVDGSLMEDYRNTSHVLTVHVTQLQPGKYVELWIPNLDSDSLGIADPYLASRDSVPVAIERLVNRPLRQESPALAIAVVTSVAGLACFALFFFRRRARDFALLYLGCASLLYGVRLLMDSQWISMVIGYPRDFWQWPIAVITYTIGIPSILLAKTALGPGWKSTLNIALGIQVSFSLAAICSDLIQGRPLTADRLNGAWALAFTLIILANLLLRSLARAPGLLALAIGFFVFTAAVVNSNMGVLGLPSWQPFGLNLEPYGFFALLACFGYYVATRSFAREEKLLSVEHELETARRIQLSILPTKIPTIAGLKIAAGYIPMTTVAGDFYDFAQVDSQHIGILVADVSGHGIPAALVASMVKIAFAGQLQHASDPARVLAGMNEILHGRMQRQFVTALYAFLDTAKRSIVYSSAGHPPAMIRRASNSLVEQLNPGGTALGPFRKSTFVNHYALLHPGDRLVLYTDGLIEASNTTQQFYGDLAFEEFIRSQFGVPVEQFVDELLKAVGRWSKNQGDDLTLVAVDSVV